MSNPIPLPPFKAFLASNIPSVYDNTLSYYDELTKLIAYIEQQVVPVVNEVASVVGSLKEYVDHYFDNLDVQEEINNKLDQMAEDGSLAELVAVYLQGKVDYYEITNQSVSDVQDIFDVERPKVISFLNDYTFNTTMHLNANTKILLNGHTLTFDVPSIIDDWQHCHGFFNFNYDDVYTTYNGNGNISILGGKIVGGNLSFCHASNIYLEGVEFSNCKNGHILEMCAIKNLTVESCTFAGIPYGASGEYIQTEAAEYSAFPWFDENSATYDGTVCQGITIKNSIFKTSSDLNYIFDAGVGTHTGQTGDAHATKGINIINCKFLNPNTSSIQFWNANGLIIEGCEFTGVSNAEASVHIRLRCGVENTSIKNCSFKGQVRGIEFASPHLDVKNVDIVNNTFEGYTATTDDPYSIITVWNPTLVNISGNQFRNFSQRCIELLKDGDTYDGTVKHETNISDNTFLPLNDIDYGCIAPACGIAYVNNNTFNCDGITIGNTRLIGVGSNAESVYARGNSVPFSLYGSAKDIYDKAYDAVTGTGGFKHIYGSPRQLWSGNTTSVTIAPTDYLIPTNFNTVMLTIGTGSNTQVITLKDFVVNEYLTARTWLFQVIATDNTVSVASLTLDSSNNLIYAGSVALRNVKLINE